MRPHLFFWLPLGESFLSSRALSLEPALIGLDSHQGPRRELAVEVLNHFESLYPADTESPSPRVMRYTPSVATRVITMANTSRDFTKIGPAEIECKSSIFYSNRFN
ncbi:hypothetical protein B0H11DRAFT_871626 [Mycena galericulata]|nr:hypothetical protein B0H11DRAFT_871626 [Mycena galericulata]